jgi:pimeloyl-ACP methyl ester carboxylesterase
LSETDNEAAIPKLLFELTTVKEEANYLLEKTGNTYQILSQLTGNQIASENDASLAKDTLEKIAHWENTRQLANPKTKLETNDLEVAIYLTDDDGNHLKDEHGKDIRLLPEKDTHEFGFDLGNEGYLACKYEVTNHSNVDLFVAALAITPTGGVIRMNEKKIPKGSHAWMNTIGEDDTEDVDAIIFWPELPDEATECVMQIKYVASTQAHIDVSKLLQDDFSEAALRSKAEEEDTNLKRFDNHPQSDWFTRDIFYKATRGAQAVTAGKSTELSSTGITINAPERFEAKVQLGNITNGTRGISSRDYFINGLVNEAEGASLWSWGNASRSTQNYDLIELSDIKGDLSAEHPLVLEMDTGLQEEEWLIPVTFDGEHILPIGFGEVNESGQAKVSIDHLPEEQIKSRSIGRALKFAFYKITSKVFKIPKEGYHKLRAVEYLDEEGKFVYDDDQGKIKDKIKASSTGILLLLHGIIGNTDGIAEFVAPLVKGKDKRYDLVLTYDYENLTTPIPDIAMQLRELLEEAGISPTHTPKVDILAHSMGGLVSRWLIEQKDGNQFVERLILCGTPNEGSPFGKIDAYFKYARIALILGLNVLSPWKNAARVAALIAGLKSAQVTTAIGSKITRTLEDMTPDSQFMKHLNDQGKDGGIPYTIFAGDIQDYLKESRPLLDKVLGMVGNIVNSKDPNDLAVKVESIKGKGKNTQVKLIDVACHHLNYFTEPNCMEPLMKVLEGE